MSASDWVVVGLLTIVSVPLLALLTGVARGRGFIEINGKRHEWNSKDDEDAQ